MIDETFINSYLFYLSQDYNKWAKVEDGNQIRNDMAQEYADGLTFTEGAKYIKIISGRKGGSRSVHSFIVKKDGPKFKAGDILKAASWNAPALNFARGNVLTFNYGTIAWPGA